MCKGYIEDELLLRESDIPLNQLLGDKNRVSLIFFGCQLDSKKDGLIFFFVFEFARQVDHEIS